ncbi:MAG: ComF family protein [Planctomycetales bacterium]|nr:ComF family protein [Planctomycetales bacterium]
MPRTLAQAAGLFRSAAGQLWQAGVDLALPPRCALCDCDIDGRAIGLCPSCDAALAVRSPATCLRCGMPVAPVGAAGNCRECARRRFAFTRVCSIGVYEGSLAEAVVRAKTLRGEVVAAALGRRLAQSVQTMMLAAPEAPPIDVVAAVPAHWLRKLHHGPPGAAVLAAACAKSLGLPLLIDLLVATRNIRKQSQLRTYERRRNVRGAFRTTWGYAIRGVHALLVDDVMTTGSTAHEVASVLLQAGAAQVSVAVAGRAHGP